MNSYKGIPKSVTELYFSVQRFLPKNPKIIEAGAHLGYDTLGLSKIWPNSMIYAFEPIPYLYNDLAKRLNGKKNVRLFNLALGEKNASVEMYISSGESSGSSSILKPSKHLEMFPDVVFESRKLVQMKTLNQWAKEENVPRIDLMWLDMQGYEVNALKGAGDFIKSVSIIYTELCKSELYEGLCTKDNYISFLNNLGFKLIEVCGDGEVSEGVFINTNIGRY